MMRRFILVLLLAGCSPAPEEPPQRQDPVVVYAAFEDAAAMVEHFDRYKEETGVLVIVRRGPADKIVNELIDNEIMPPADLLLTESVVHALRAAEESALRPLYSDVLRETVPEWARDADDLWFGTSTADAVLVHNVAGLEVSAIEDFGILAEQRFDGTLCLTSSTLPVNRAVIAMMIGELGVRPTELIVRDWVKNLAVPPFDTEVRIIDALGAGTCSIAIVSRDAAVNAGLDIHIPQAAYADVATLGVARHARNPEGAAALAEWLISEIASMQIHREDGPNVGLVAWHYEDAIKLAERARYP